MTSTSVAFAPTPPFVAAFGEAEAAKQRAKFDEGNPLLKEEHQHDDNAFLGIVIVGALLAGFGLGIVVTMKYLCT